MMGLIGALADDYATLTWVKQHPNSALPGNQEHLSQQMWTFPPQRKTCETNTSPPYCIMAPRSNDKKCYIDSCHLTTKVKIKKRSRYIHVKVQYSPIYTCFLLQISSICINPPNHHLLTHPYLRNNSPLPQFPQAHPPSSLCTLCRSREKGAYLHGLFTGRCHHADVRARCASLMAGRSRWRGCGALWLRWCCCRILLHTFKWWWDCATTLVG